MMSHPAPNAFCSALSAEGNEPLAGTAMSGQQYVFISYPKIWWAKEQYKSLNFPNSLAEYLQNIQKEKKILSRLIYKQGQNKNFSQIYIMPDAIVYRNIPISEVENVLRSYFDKSEDKTYREEDAKGNYIFCCTHGIRDKCCAKFGQSVVYEFQRASLEQNYDLDVWECTHIGGDRFAATAISFPQKFAYGRLRAENVSIVVSYLKKGYPYPPLYRGEMGLKWVEQISQAFGHYYWFDNNIEDAKVIVEEISQANPKKQEAFVTIKNKFKEDIYAKFHLVLQEEDFQTYIDCDRVKLAETRQVSRWVVNEAHLIN